MEIGTIVDEGLGNASYVVDVGDGRALVIDPGRDPRPYLEEAHRRHLAIAFVADTHLHADFVSGSRELQALGATVLASAEAGLGFPHRGLRDEEVVELGGLALLALATPGHTPEHLSYVLLDGSSPVAVFTGGALLRGSVARTDLLGPEQTEPLARALYRSIHERLFTLPHDLRAYPTHGAGATFCAVTPTATGDGPFTTIGQEKETSPLLRASDEEAFARELVATYGSYPRYFLRLRDVNRRGPRVYGEHPPDLRALSIAGFRAELAEGAELIDARPIEEFAAGHIPGALSIELRPAFATWVGWLVREGRPLLCVLGEDQDRSELVWHCLKIGYEDLAGELVGGMVAWEAAGLPVRRIGLVAAAEVAGGVLDVRQDAEFTAGHVPGARHVELGSLPDAIERVDGDRIAVMCGHGERAMTAASLLARAEPFDLTVALGGPDDWAAANELPLEIGR